MIQDPVMHFLRVPPGSGPFAVLGLRPAEYRAGQIEQALFRQLQRIDAHADAGTPEAKQVRERVVVAARILRDPEQRDRLLREFKAIRQETEHEPALLGTEPVAAPAPRPMPRPLAPTSNGPSASSARRTERPALRLTEFDRQVLAVLVGGGGWNADSRARLVALAATYGVSVQGLIRVVTGLAAYAASGGATLGVREITAGSSRMTMARPSEDLDGPSTEREWVDRVAPEFLEGDTWSTVKLALLFSLLTLFVAIVVTRFLVQSGDATIVASIPTPAIVAPPPVVEPTVRQPAPEPEIALVTFDEFPTFQGDARPDVALEAAARSGELPGLLDALSRRLYVRTGDPSDAAYREWALLVDQAATGWVLMSDARLDAVHAGLFEVFYAAADAPTISDRLLAEVTPDPSRADVPLEVWRDAWKAGFLAKVASSQTMSPATVDRARRALAGALGVDEAAATPSFEQAAGRWLVGLIPRMVDSTEHDDGALNRWELWIEAVHRVERGSSAQAAFVEAIGAMLRTGIDLSRPRPSQQVVGRLLRALDLRDNAIVKARLLEVASDERVEMHDLWVLTSLLAQTDRAPWFDRRLVIEPDSTAATRRRKLARIEHAWVVAVGGAGDGDGGAAIAVDETLGARLVATFVEIMRRPGGGDEVDAAQRVLAACRLVQAMAHAAAGEDAASHDVLDSLSPRASSGVPGGPAPRIGSGGARPATRSTPGLAPSPGQAIGQDGVWATEFERLRGDANAQLQHLVTLQQNAGSDLGHRDAEVFVTALLKGRAAEIRATAESILGQRFANGPVVVLELLDQFTDALPRQSVSDLIAQITGDVLPPLRATGWRFAARTALTRHALALRSDRLAEVDDTAGRVRESCESQLSILRRHSAVSMASRSAHEAAERLASEWREQARGRTPREPVPGPFATIERRQATIAQLAAGPIERYVAARLATLEWLAFVTADEAPGLRTRIGRLLDDATASRRETTHILDQAFEVDLAIARLWLVRIGLGRALDAALAEGGGS